MSLIAILLSLSAIFAYINKKFIKLPSAIGLMAVSIVFSLGIAFLGKSLFGLDSVAEQWLRQIDFHSVVMDVMLAFLLFAGALHVSFKDLKEVGGAIALTSTLGLLLSSLIIGFLLLQSFALLGISLPWIYCWLFGALISPTDPIAVMGILKKAGVSQAIESKIVGESLINDGVGVVLFLMLVGVLQSGFDAVSAQDVLYLFLQEAVGGALIGLLLGQTAFYLLRTIDDYQVEVLMTLALVCGGYTLAQYLHSSGPIAMVAAGLLIGNPGRRDAMSTETRKRLDEFWELVDGILNAVLFVLIGLETLLIKVDSSNFWLLFVAIPIVLFARFLSIGSAINLLKLFGSKFNPHSIKLLWWGGLRGGISIALALSLPQSEFKEMIVKMTYGVVVFSVLIQGLTVGPLANKLRGKNVDPKAVL